MLQLGTAGKWCVIIALVLGVVFRFSDVVLWSGSVSHALISRGVFQFGLQVPPPANPWPTLAEVSDPWNPPHPTIIRARLIMISISDSLRIYYRLPLWQPLMLLLVGAYVFSFDRRRRQINIAGCLSCGYDLRATTSDRCSECGEPILQNERDAIAERETPRGAIAVVYAGTAIAITLSTDSLTSISPIWWNSAPLLERILIGMCGPMSPFVELGRANWGESLMGLLFVVFSCALVWLICFYLVFKPRAQNLSLMSHFLLAVMVFSLGSSFVGTVVWIVRNAIQSLNS